VAWPEPAPDPEELGRYDIMASQARAAAESRRFALFSIELQQGQELIAAADALAFARADESRLPGRIRNVVRYTFDEPLGRAVHASPYVVDARAVDRLLADRARAVAEPGVFAALSLVPLRPSMRNGDVGSAWGTSSPREGVAILWRVAGELGRRRPLAHV
jgi:hypothetical protein